MDVLLLLSVATLIVLFIVFISVYFRRGAGKRKERNEEEERAAPARQVRRAAGQRIARRRMQANVNYQDEEENDSGNEANDEGTDKPDLTDLKIGAKKRAKLAAKAEKKIQREAAERERESRKKREQKNQEERDKQYEKEKAEEQKQEEEERRAREEKERRDHDEYLKMKEAFSIEEEGFDEEDEEAQENLLQEFINYIKQQKVVVLEDLAAKFSLKTANVIERIQELQASETLTGVIDDRGKFIYISQDELEAVASFIRQRGRVSIAELAESSTELINLNPSNKKEIEAR